VLQCVAVCCSGLQCVAVRCIDLFASPECFAGHVYKWSVSLIEKKRKSACVREKVRELC